MIEVSARDACAAEDEVQIVVNGSGENLLTIDAQGISKELLVRSQSIGNGLGTRVSISQ